MDCLHLTLRISAMVENLCSNFGEKICEIKTNDDNGTTKSFYAFPKVEKLAENPAKVQRKLAELKFGYRAGFIAKSASQIQVRGASYPRSLPGFP